MSTDIQEFTKRIATLQNAMKTAISTAFPIEHTLVRESVEQSNTLEEEVFVGVGAQTHDGLIKGYLSLEGSYKAFATLAVGMFGFEPEGEMLESFILEASNMFGGNVGTCFGVEYPSTLDINPPLMLEGGKIKGYSYCARVEMEISGGHRLIAKFLIYDKMAGVQEWMEQVA